MHSCEIIQNTFEKWHTDKARHKSYARVYSDIFNQLEPKRILEFGVWKGQSLNVWSELFPKAEVVGVDWVDPTRYCDNSCGLLYTHTPKTDNCWPCSNVFFSKNVKVIVGDLRNIAPQDIDPDNKKFDLIIDDAGHELDQYDSTLLYLKILREQGFFVVEDVSPNLIDTLKKLVPSNYKCTHYLNFQTGVEDECMMVIHEKY